MDLNEWNSASRIRFPVFFLLSSSKPLKFVTESTLVIITEHKTVQTY